MSADGRSGAEEIDEGVEGPASWSCVLLLDGELGWRSDDEALGA